MIVAEQDQATAMPREAIIVICGLLLIAGINMMLWLVDYPPLTDWPNHLARHALQCSSDPEAGLARYYSYEFTWVPNLASELVHRLPMACVSLLTTQKVLIQFSMTGLLTATVLLHASIWRRWSAWPLLGAFGLSHMALGYGFENYVLSMPPTLLGLALWFWRRDRLALGRLLPMIPVAGVLYIFHLYAFVFFFGMLALLELQKSWQSRDQQGAEHRSVLLLLLAVACGPVLHLASVAVGTAGINPGATEFGSVIRRLTTVLSPFTALGVPFLDPAILRVAALQLAALALIWTALRFFDMPHSVQTGTGLALTGMMVVTFAFPSKLGGVILTDIRFPTMMLCVFVACSDVRFSRVGAGIFGLAVVAVVFIRTDWLESRWAAHDAEVRELLAAEALLHADDRMLVVRAGDAWAVILHSHSASHLARRVGLFIPDIFSGGNAVSARDEVSSRDAFASFPPPVDAVIDEARRPSGIDLQAADHRIRYWVDWPSFYTHVLVLGTNNGPVPDAPELGVEVFRGSFFALFQTHGSSN